MIEENTREEENIMKLIENISLGILFYTRQLFIYLLTQTMQEREMVSMYSTENYYISNEKRKNWKYIRPFYFSILCMYNISYFGFGKLQFTWIIFVFIIIFFSTPSFCCSVFLFCTLFYTCKMKNTYKHPSKANTLTFFQV